MANKFGYSGSLGYNSFKVSRGGNCCCPPKGDPGPKGDTGHPGIKGDVGPTGAKGDSTSLTQHGLFIYDGGDSNPYNINGELDISMNAADTSNFGNKNENFINEVTLSDNSLISFKNLKSPNIKGIAEFYVHGTFNYGSITGPSGTMIYCDLSCNNPIASSEGLINIDSLFFGQGVSSSAIGCTFGPVSYLVSSHTTNASNYIHFDNEYILKLRTSNQVIVDNDLRLMVKFRPIN